MARGEGGSVDHVAGRIAAGVIPAQPPFTDWLILLLVLFRAGRQASGRLWQQENPSGPAGPA
jgi:hypothetical protein